MTIQTTDLVIQLGEALCQTNSKVCTVESCTGGLIAKSFTDISGSSRWFERGFVTYSNESKTEMLGISASVIEEYGAVSEPVATAMAMGALKHSHANYSVAVTGVAGPDGGSDEKPVGTVWIGVASCHQACAKKYLFAGNRAVIRQLTMEHANKNLLNLLETV